MSKSGCSSFFPCFQSKQKPKAKLKQQKYKDSLLTNSLGTQTSSNNQVRSVPNFRSYSFNSHKSTIAVKVGSSFQPQPLLRISRNSTSSINFSGEETILHQPDPLLGSKSFRELFSSQKDKGVSWNTNFLGNAPKPKVKNPFVLESQRKMPKIKPITPHNNIFSKGTRKNPESFSRYFMNNCGKKSLFEVSLEDYNSRFHESSDSLVKL